MVHTFSFGSKADDLRSRDVAGAGLPTECLHNGTRNKLEGAISRPKYYKFTCTNKKILYCWQHILPIIHLTNEYIKVLSYDRSYKRDSLHRVRNEEELQILHYACFLVVTQPLKYWSLPTTHN